MQNQVIEGFRLSPQQARIWGLQQQSPAYRAQCGVRIEGALDRAAMAQALQDLVDRHEILRTEFQVLPGMELPIQVIAHSAPVAFEALDLSGLPVDRQADETRRIFEQQAAAHCLGRSPAIRFCMARLSGQSHLLCISLPAMCGDAGTFRPLLIDLGNCYEARRHDQTPAGEPVQFIQVSEWQNELLEEDEQKLGRDYWKRFDVRSLAAFTLPFEEKRGPAGFAPQSHTVTIDAAMVSAVERIARQCEAGPAAFWLACWQVLLARLGNERRITTGCGMDGRQYEELQDTLGPFVRYVPVEAQIEAACRFSEIVRQAGQSSAEARMWQEYFHWDATAEPDAGQAEPSFFPVIFEYGQPLSTVTADGLSMSIAHLDACNDRFKIKLKVEHGPMDATLQFDYDTAAFAAAAIEQIAEHLTALARHAIADPAAFVDDLDVLSERQRRHLLVELNRTATDYPRLATVQQLFEAQVARTPENIAIESDGRRLSFAELNGQANQLAHYLQSLGVGPEVQVGLCVERSLEMAVGILGILKAGGAYVPLNYADPADRLGFMLSDSQVSVLLSQSHLLALLPETPARIVCLDSDWEVINRQRADNPQSDVTAENLAYVIYTSGSTGRPKGTLIHHRGLVNYLYWCTRAYEVEGGNGAPVHSPVTFDLTITSLFSPLLAGRKVVMLPEALGIETLLTALKEGSDYSLVKLTPAHLELLGQQLSTAEAAGRTRALIIGGEALMAEAITFWREHAPQTRLINEYGPTETVVGCCVYEVPPGDLKPGPVLIGRPIANTSLYILDERMQPVPMGVTGELYIGGDGVGRGYHNRPSLTAEKFVPDAFGQSVGARLYKTGDLARYMADGNIDFLGRADHQVKIHGYRIELGEIETVLRQHAAVLEATVIAREDHPGDRRLVAYVVCAGGAKPTIDELRGFLRQSLPDYMAPWAYVFLDALPLTRSGKVDRRALPAPDAARTDARAAFVAPHTQAEAALAEIWADVLRVDEVGIDDNFFALGGDSIRSIQVRTRAVQKGLDISNEQIFRYQTVRQLAGLLESETLQSPLTPLAEPFSLIAPEDRLRLPGGIEDAYPLTVLQAGMLFHSEFNPESAVYHDLHSFHLQVRFDDERLREAIRQVTSRHAVLRTAFDLATFSEPLQLVFETAEIPLAVEDLRALSTEQQAQAIAVAIEAEKRHHFDWHTAPLLRFSAHRRTEATFQLTLSFHHAILDGWSVASLLTELFHCYVNLLDGQQPDAGELAITFRDFAALERETVNSPISQAFWDDQLQASSISRLPRRESSATTAAPPSINIQSIPITEALSAGLKELARSASVPIKSVLLAAHLRVMSLLTGQSDVMTGLVSNGRPEENDGDRVLGLFLNTVPVRIKLKDGSWADLARQVFDIERDLMPHRRYPLAELQRRHGSQPLFEVAFNFMHYHVYQSLGQLSDVQLLDYVGYEETNFTLTANFSLDPALSQVRLSLNYHPAELTEAQVEAIAGYYLRTLAAMATDPEQNFNLAEIMSEAERQQILIDWNQTATEYGQAGFVHQLIAQQAARTPAAVAVRFQHHTLTYAQLDARANQLAHFLQARGVGPDRLVGICLPRSLDLIVALVATLKAGAAFVPIDPTYPAQRIAYMLEDAGTDWLLSQPEVAAGLPPQAGRLICLERDRAAIAACPPTAPTVELSGDHLAYVLYTSGSTGRPKGAMNTQAGLRNRLLWMQEVYQLSSADRVLQKTPMSFDVSVWEYFWPLMTGACLVVTVPEGHKDSRYLVEVMKREAVSVAHFVPAMLQVFLSEEGIEELTELRQVICSGEALGRELARRAGERLAGELDNLYGPTEAAIDVTRWRCERGSERREVPIGRAIANTQMYVLDEELKVVPVGVRGELYIGGVQVGRGYWKRAEQTAERYVPNPYGEAGSRMYRTGDEGRYGEEGEIEYIGRGDEQVKIRGMRIEVGEVEAVLAEVSGEEAAVVVKGEGSGKRLVGYVVGEGEGEELKRRLRERLPEWMVPAVIEYVEELPKQPNGKVDRGELRKREEKGEEAGVEVEWAKGEEEERVERIWVEVLGRERIGRRENFFEIGGHSLVATQVMSRVRRELEVEVELRSLFEAPTIAGLAEIIRQARLGNGAKAQFIPRRSKNQLAAVEHKDLDLLFAEIEGLSDSEALSQLDTEARVSTTQDLAPLSFSQERVWQLEQDSPGFFNMPLAMRLTGQLDTSVLGRALDEIIRRHESLRTTVVLVDGAPMQRVSPYAAQAMLPITDLCHLPADEREAAMRRLMAEEVQRPFVLDVGPLLRVQLIRLDEQDHVVLLTMHQIISDAWSLGVLIREVAALYEMLAKDEPAALPELPIQLADYAQWERDWLQGKRFESLAEYWNTQLGGDLRPLELPTDRPRPPVLSFRGASESLNLSARLASGLKRLCREEEVTLFMLLVGAFKLLLSKAAGQTDITVGIPAAGRNWAETESLIGSFANTLVLRSDLGGNPTFRDFIAQVRETTLGAYAHQQMPYSKLVEILRPGQTLKQRPLFRVMFDLLLADDSASGPQLPGLAVSLLQPDTGELIVGNDLTFAIQETGDELLATLRYKKELFDPATIARLLEQFRALLAEVTGNPDIRLGDLQLETAAPVV